jgi:chromosome segregation ATPase
MKKILFIVFLFVSMTAFAVDTDTLFNNMLSRSQDFVAFTGAGFEARFIPAYAVADAQDGQIEIEEDLYLLGLFVFRSERSMNIQLDSIQIMNATSDERIEGQFFRVEELFAPIQLPIVLPSGGIIVLTSQVALQDYFMDVRVQNILLPWRVRTVEPDRTVEIAPVSIEVQPPSTDTADLEGYESINESIADLNERLNFLQDNVEGLNLQFRRLNTLFLDTQIALAEYKASVDNSVIDLQEQRFIFEQRVEALESALSTTTFDSDTLDSLRASIENLNTEVQGIEHELRIIDETKSSHEELKTLLGEHEKTIEELRAAIGSISSSASDTEKFSSIEKAIEENRVALEVLGGDLQNAKVSLADDLETIKTSSLELVEAHGRIDERIIELEREITRVGSVSENAASSLSEALISISSVTEQFESFKNIVMDELTRSYEESIASLGDMESRVSVIETSLANLESLEGELNNQREELRAYGDILNRSITRIDSIDKSVEELEALVQSLDSVLKNLTPSSQDSLGSFLSNLEEQVGTLRESVGSLSIGFVRMNSELIQVKESIPPEGVSPEAFSQTIFELNSKISDIETIFTSLEAKIGGLNVSLANIDKRLQAAAIEIDSLKGNFDGSVTAIDNNLKSIQKLQTESTQLKALIEENSRNLATFRGEIESRLDATLVSRDEIQMIVDEAVSAAKEETEKEISSLKRSNNIWLTVAVLSSVAAIVLGVLNIMEIP